MGSFVHVEIGQFILRDEGRGLFVQGLVRAVDADTVAVGSNVVRRVPRDQVVFAGTRAECVQERQRRLPPVPQEIVARREALRRISNRLAALEDRPEDISDEDVAAIEAILFKTGGE